jgi:hypothetical protein
MRNGGFQERKPRSSTNTKVGHRMRVLASGVIESSSSSFETGDHQAPSNPSHPSLLTLANSVSTTPAFLYHT